MKKRKAFFQMMVFSALVAFGVTACGGGGGGGSQVSSRQETIKVSVAEGGSPNLILGQAVQLQSTVAGVSWESDKPDIASVDANGLVTSKAVGSAKITASKDGYRAGSITIKVDLQTINVTASATSVVKGETITLTADQQGVTWASSNASVATVDGGVVTGVNFGEATITASKEGFNPGSVTISVTRPAPTATLHFENADHFAADGEWSKYSGDTSTPVYEKEQASDGTCIAYFGAGDRETLTFSSNKDVKAELVITMLSRTSYNDLATLMTVKFNDVDVAISGSYTGGNDYPIGELSLGELDVKSGNNVVQIDFLNATPYLDDLNIYAAEAAEIAIVLPVAKDPVPVNQESITVAEGKTAQITSSVSGLSFKSADTSIATVADDGTVTGVKVGSTSIVVSKEGYATIRVPVTVTEAEGVIVVQVESGTSENDAVTFKTSNNLESGNLMVDAWPVDAVLTLNVNNEGAAGAYNLFMNARAHGGYQSSSEDDLATCIELKVNGTKLDMTGTVAGGPFAIYELGEVNLNAGANVMTIKCFTDAPTIDLFRFIPKA